MASYVWMEKEMEYKLFKRQTNIDKQKQQKDFDDVGDSASSISSSVSGASGSVSDVSCISSAVSGNPIKDF